ncbi:MAG: tRNA lysidine(34) synthetase TilS [Dehalococcoidia bacterium]|nr:tRNA lysidine(34) synthetase TilS [Dehalococcoidia bacterium]
MNPLEKHIKSSLEQNGFAGIERLLLVGVSGGPDSVCLLHALHAIAKDSGLRIHVAHLNHGLRGKESKADANFVQSLAKTLGLPSTIRLADTLAFKKAYKLTTEQAARELRYRFFYALAKELKADAVVLGHTADDQAETVLMHMIRGAGLKGIGGMSEMSDWRMKSSTPAITILRPLLHITRKETHDYCDKLKLDPRTDSSNQSLEFWRNRIRLQLMPELRKHNPEIVSSLRRLATLAREGNDFINVAAQNVINSLGSASGNGIAFRTDRFQQVHKTVQGAAVRMAIKTVSGSLDDIEETHVDAVLSLLNARAGSGANISLGMHAVRLYNELWLGSGEPPSPWPPLKKSYVIKVPGTTRAGPWDVLAESSGLKSIRNGHDRMQVSLRKDALKGKLTLRPWGAGDMIVPLGMKGHKKLQDVFVDEKVPRHWRKNIPVLCDDDKVLWVTGFKTSEEAKTTKETREVITISLQKSGR